MPTISMRLWALAILSGLMQVLPFPFAGPVPLWRTAFGWFALTPLLASILSRDPFGAPLRGLSAVFLGYASGILFYLLSCHWILATMHAYDGLPVPVAAGILVLFSLYLGLYPALFAGLLASVRLRFGRQVALLISPVVWVATELARARITSFPWSQLGITQVDNPLLTRLAPFAGAYALSFVIALVNALWLVRFQVRDRRYIRPAIAALCVVVFVAYAMALRRLPSADSDATQSATLVQENLSVGMEGRAAAETIADKLASFSSLSLHPSIAGLNGIPGLDNTKLIRLPHAAPAELPSGKPYQPADVVIWPESPADFHTNDPAFQAATYALATSIHAPLILGSLGIVPDPSLERGGRIYDSAALIAADGSQQGRYDKIHLVPFGEYVPFKQLLFFADRLTAGVGDMDRGTERTVFRTQTAGATHAFGIFVCYESIFADEVRQFVQNGAEVLVNISDDGWYGDSGAAWQHLNMVRMRAIENRRWVLRATNTGITASIDPYGRVVAALPRRIRAAIVVPFAFRQGTTFYTRHGDWFAYTCAALTVAMLCVRRRHPVN